MKINQTVRHKLVVVSTLLLMLMILGSCIYSSMGAKTSKAITSHGKISKQLIDNPSTPKSKIYFDAPFTSVQTAFALNTNWPSEEPCTYNNQLGVWHWVNNGNLYGNMKLVQDPNNPDSTCLQMILDANGTRPLSHNQHVKLYECQDRESSLWDEPYKSTKEAYWQMKYWFPANFEVASWRLIWQICGEKEVYGNPSFPSYPQLQLTFDQTALYLENAGFYYTNGIRHDYHITNIADLPKESWVTITVYMKQGSTFRAEDGIVKIWINNELSFENRNMSTATYTGTPYIIWGIGNYGSPYEAQGQYINIKETTVTSTYP